ncbi:MAG: hypothetical protein LAT76_12365, partial [Schleiferiaceae bacterium]|nr:hypothetical protein [Schleiferiaceae bacterium]
MENSGEEGGYSPKKKLILKWVMVIFITHFFIVNLFGNNNSIESLTEYPSPAAIAKEETRLNALLQNESPLSVFEEIESLSQYIRKFGAITQPELAIRFFKHLVDLEGNSHFHLKNKIVDLGLNFSSTLVSQKAYEEAEILMDLLASSFTNLPENQHFDYQSINVFRFLNTGQEDSALFVAQESLALLAKENGLLPFEKSKYFSAFINALAQVNEQKEAWTYFEMYEAYYRKWRKAAQNQKLRNQLDWEYFSLGLHLNSNVESLSKASAFYSGIQQLHKKGAHKKIHDYNQKTIFNHLINYAINLRLNREIEVAKSVNLYGVKVSEEIGYVNGLSGFYGNLAYLGIDEEKPEDTYKYASKAIELGLLVGAEQLPNYYNILAGACIQLQQLEQAKSAVLEAARLLLNPDVVWEDLATLDFESVKNQDYVVLSFALEGLGYNLTILNDYEGGETFLPIANQFFRLGAIAYSQVVHLNKNTRELDYLYNTIHEGLMNTCLLLDNCDVSEALSITEKNKMLTQMHYLIFGEANLGSFSSSLEVQEIKKLQKDLASLNRTKKENRNAAEEQRIQANIESIERNIGDWQATFNKKNPQFKSLFNQNLNITRLVNTL